MVQVLPHVPGFGERLGQVLGEALGNAGQGYIQGKVKKNAWNQFMELNNPQGAPGNVADLQAQGQAGQAPGGVQGLLNQQNQPSAISQAEKLAKSYELYAIANGKDAADKWFGVKSKEIEGAAKEGADIRAEERKLQQETLAKKKNAKITISSAEEMKKLLKYTGTTKNPLFLSSFNATPNGLNRTGLKKRNEFDTLAASLANFFRDLDTKGQLPQGLYEQVIKPRLPNSELSEAENEGRLDGAIELARKFGGLEEDSLSESKKSPDVEVGQSFEKLPSAASYPNAVFKNGSKKYRSNGKNWEEM